MGSRNHEVVPTPLISQIGNSRGGTGVHKCISTLAKANLIAKVKNARYDGYRLTYGGIDYLALNAHRKSQVIYSVGNQIGVGKESDIYVVASHSGLQRVLKIHRLGRISFRTVKANRDYLRNRNSGSWMYMSRLAALKEYTFMQALRDNGFPVPEPIAHNRHTIVMSLIDAFPLRQISRVREDATAGLYAELMALIVRFASYGLIHGDFNEFNILIEEKPHATKTNEDGTPLITLHPIVIDFPQMVSISHPDAEDYFKRDVECIKTYFYRKYKFTSDDAGPFFKDATKTLVKRLDGEAEATGFSKKMAKELEKYMKEVGVDGDGAAGGPAAAEEGEDEDEDASEAEDTDDAVEGETEAQYTADPSAPPQFSADPAPNDDPSIPDVNVNAAFTVLDIKDFEDPASPAALTAGPALAPSVMGSVAPSTRTAAKKAAGWAL